MILCDRRVARKHSQYRLNRPLTQARNIVTMRRARDLGDTEALIDLVSEKAKQIAATVRIQNLGAPTPPNEQKKGRQQVLSAVTDHRKTLSSGRPGRLAPASKYSPQALPGVGQQGRLPPPH